MRKTVDNFCVIMQLMAKPYEKQVQKAQQITLNIKDAVVGSNYTQLAVVTATDIDITINFVYINPRAKTQGQVVSRVTMPRPAGEELAKVILTTVKLHEEGRREKKDGGN